MSSCPPFWLDEPRILIEQAAEFFPFTENDKRCTAAALNSFTRFGIYLGIVLALVRMEVLWLAVSVGFAVFSVGAWFYMGARGAVREGFAQWGLNLLGLSDSREDFLDGADTEAPIVDSSKLGGDYVPDVIGEQGRTEPTAANPFMNVLLTEIGDNPYRKPAANVQGYRVRNELDDYFQTMFSSDPGDVFQHTQGQRQFYTTPSSTVPNDQGSFADWLYRVPGQTCKEGNQEVCTFDTGPATYPWREMRKLT
jgi:hypothetical protein